MRGRSRAGARRRRASTICRSWLAWPRRRTGSRGSTSRTWEPSRRSPRCVCFQDGIPLKSGYRRFRIKQVHGPDDVAMIGEVLQRRLRRLRDRRGGAARPDPDRRRGRGRSGAARDVLADEGFAGDPPPGAGEDGRNCRASRRVGAASPAPKVSAALRLSSGCGMRRIVSPSATIASSGARIRCDRASTPCRGSDRGGGRCFCVTSAASRRCGAASRETTCARARESAPNGRADSREALGKESPGARSGRWRRPA